MVFLNLKFVLLVKIKSNSKKKEELKNICDKSRSSVEQQLNSQIYFRLTRDCEDRKKSVLVMITQKRSIVSSWQHSGVHTVMRWEENLSQHKREQWKFETVNQHCWTRAREEKSEISLSDGAHFSVDYPRQHSAEKSKNLNLILAFIPRWNEKIASTGSKHITKYFTTKRNCFKNVSIKFSKTFQKCFKLIWAGKRFYLME